MLKTLHFGFNFPYKGEITDYQTAGTKIYSDLFKFSNNFSFQLEVGGNIKNNVHFQGYFKTENPTNLKIIKEKILNYPGLHIDFLDSKDHITNTILYSKKNKTCYGRKFAYYEDPKLANIYSPNNNEMPKQNILDMGVCGKPQNPMELNFD